MVQADQDRAREKLPDGQAGVPNDHSGGQEADERLPTYRGIGGWNSQSKGSAGANERFIRQD